MGDLIRRLWDGANAEAPAGPEAAPSPQVEREVGRHRFFRDEWERQSRQDAIAEHNQAALDAQTQRERESVAPVTVEQQKAYLSRIGQDVDTEVPSDLARLPSPAYDRVKESGRVPVTPERIAERFGQAFPSVKTQKDARALEDALDITEAVALWREQNEWPGAPRTPPPFTPDEARQFKVSVAASRERGRLEAEAAARDLPLAQKIQAGARNVARGVTAGLVDPADFAGAYGGSPESTKDRLEEYEARAPFGERVALTAASVVPAILPLGRLTQVMESVGIAREAAGTLALGIYSAVATPEGRDAAGRRRPATLGERAEAGVHGLAFGAAAGAAGAILRPTTAAAVRGFMEKMPAVEQVAFARYLGHVVKEVVPEAGSWAIAAQALNPDGDPLIDAAVGGALGMWRGLRAAMRTPPPPPMQRAPREPKPTGPKPGEPPPEDPGVLSPEVLEAVREAAPASVPSRKAPGRPQDAPEGGDGPLFAPRAGARPAAPPEAPRVQESPKTEATGPAEAAGPLDLTRPPPVRRVAEGREVTIPVTGAEPVKARYALMEGADVTPSHDPARGFDPIPSYPTENRLQERDYRKQELQEVLGERRRRFDPAEMVNTAPRASDGPSTVSPEGIVINGNGREILRRTLSPEQRRQYRDYLEAHAAEFGLDPAAVRSAKDPVLVRVVDMDPRTPEAAEFGRRGNMTATASVTPLERASRTADLIPEEVLRELSGDPDLTFSEAVVDVSKGRAFRRALADSMAAEERAEFFQNDGTLTPAGKDLANNVLLVKALGPEAAGQLPAQLRKTLGDASVQLGQIARDPALVDVRDTMRDALKAYRETLDNGRVSPREAYDEPSLMAPEPISDGARAMLDFLYANRAAARRLRDGLSGAIHQRLQEGGMFGQEPVADTLRRAFTEEAPRVAAVSGAQPGTMVLPASSFAAQGGSAVPPTVQGAGRALRRAWDWVQQRAFPTVTRANPDASAEMTRWASSHSRAITGAESWVRQVFGRDPSIRERGEFGAAATEFQLRSIQAEARLRLGAAWERYQAAETIGAKRSAKAELERLATASKGATLVGAEGSPFKTQADYDAYMAKPETKERIARHVELWNKAGGPEDAWRALQDIPEGLERARGTRDAFRINLMTTAQAHDLLSAGRQAAGKPQNILQRRHAFGRAATGMGDYHLDYQDIIQNTLSRTLNAYGQKATIERLVADGDAVWAAPGERGPETIKGSPVDSLTLKPYGLQSKRIRDPRAPDAVDAEGMLLDTGEAGAKPKKIDAATFYVRGDFGRELLTAANLGGMKILDPDGGLTKAFDAMTRAALYGPADNLVNTANDLALAFTSPGTGVRPSSAVRDVVANAMPGLAPVTSLGRVLRNFKRPADYVERKARLAEIGAWEIREEPFQQPRDYGNPLKYLDWLGQRTNESLRFVLDDAYTHLVKVAGADPHPTARRDFINRAGLRNSRMLDRLTVALRDTISPYTIAAKKNRGAALRTLTLDPGARPTSMRSALAMRAMVLAKWASFASTMAAAQYLVSGSPLPRVGVPLGAIDLGTTDEKGRPEYFDVAAILGIRQALNVLGAGGAIERARQGQGAGEQANAALTQAVNSLLVRWVSGPVTNAAATLTTGRGSFYMGAPSIAKAPGEGQSFMKERAIAAAKAAFQPAALLLSQLGDIFPPVKDFVGDVDDEDTGDELAKLLAYFSVKKGPANVDTLPERMKYVRLNEWLVDYKARLRKVNEARREAWATEQVNRDWQTPNLRDRAMRDMQREVQLLRGR